MMCTAVLGLQSLASLCRLLPVCHVPDMLQSVWQHMHQHATPLFAMTAPMQLVQDEFMRGVTICDDFLSQSGKVSWARLFEEDNFFQQFKNYLQIEVVAADEQQFRAWEGWVHSR